MGINKQYMLTIQGPKCTIKLYTPQILQLCCLINLTYLKLNILAIINTL